MAEWVQSRILKLNWLYKRGHNLDSIGHGLALKEGVNQELDRLEANGILKRVDFSQWAAPIVVVPKKDGGLRLCGDYKLTVNPTLDIDVTKIDLCNAYQQMVLEDPSKELPIRVYTNIPGYLLGCHQPLQYSSEQWIRSWLAFHT